MIHLKGKIQADLPTFSTTDSLAEVIAFFEKTMFSHVAIAEKGDYVGVLSENDLASFEANKSVEDVRYLFENFHVSHDAAWLDVLETFSKNECNLLPVLNQDQAFVGYYDLNEVVEAFIDTPFFREPGSILVVNTGIKDYSFSEMAQIVESNNTKLLGAFISDSKNDVVQITLKIGTGNLNDVIQTFRRYNYEILFGNNDDQFLEDLKQRSDYLDKYLNV